MTFDPKKHHRRSIRLSEHDYTQPGAYYITICTYQKQCWFGDIVDGEIHYNQLGYIVYSFWQALPLRFQHIQLDGFVVMPNHLHGILIITNIEEKTQVNNKRKKEKFGKPIAGSIPTIIGAFKSSVTKRINLMRPNKIPPIWQDNYYESIVRIESGLDAIREYIINNPYQWEMDEDNPKYHSHEKLDLNLYF